MARPKEVLDEALVEQGRGELKKIRDRRTVLQLQAIVSCSQHPMQTVAAVLGVSRQALWRWIKRFRAAGVGGLADRPKGHNPRKLDDRQRHSVARWIEEQRDGAGAPAHWTLEKLCEEIRQQFGVRVGLTPLWHMVRALGFRPKTPRPRHRAANPEAQEAFKKNG